MSDLALQHYSTVLASLNTNKNTKHWSAATNFRAPHKPLLLLTVADLVAQGHLRGGFVEFDDRLLEGFDRYWTLVFGPGQPGNPTLPFFHLRTDGFWSLVPRPELADAESSQIYSPGKMRTLVLGARLSSDLFDLLARMDTRNRLRRILIETYFAPSLRPRLFAAAETAIEAAAYETLLRNRVRDRFAMQETAPEEVRYRVEARSAAFRRTVVTAYNATCAMCGVRITTPEGRVAVDAAHVVPWSVSHNDDPRNGLALCGLHHWTFDHGLAGITTGFQIRISSLVTDTLGTEPLLLLADQKIHRPADEEYWPASEALAWHFEHVFRR